VLAFVQVAEHRPLHQKAYQRDHQRGDDQGQPETQGALAEQRGHV
jgi:hypothetical protein